MSWAIGLGGHYLGQLVFPGGMDVSLEFIQGETVVDVNRELGRPEASPHEIPGPDSRSSQLRSIRPRCRTQAVRIENVQHRHAASPELVSREDTDWRAMSASTSERLKNISPVVPLPLSAGTMRPDLTQRVSVERSMCRRPAASADPIGSVVVVAM